MDGNILLPSAVYIKADLRIGMSPHPQPFPCLCSRLACCSCRYSGVDKTGACSLFSLRICAFLFSAFIARTSGASIITRADKVPQVGQRLGSDEFSRLARS